MSENALLDAALYYASQGWPVFPCWWARDGKCGCPDPACERSAGKHCISTLVPHSHLDATVEESVIREWWGRYPQANIGLRCGNGLAVIDFDYYNGGDVSLEALEANHGKLPYSLRAKSGSGDGSFHLYLTYPEGYEVRSGKGKLGPGIDVKSTGGYVIAPPSSHRSGGNYHWDDEDESRIEPMPMWMLDLLKAKPAGEPDEEDAALLEDGLSPAYARLVADKLFQRATAKASEGMSRHDAWVWFAQQCRAGLVSAEVCLEYLDPWLDFSRETGKQRALDAAELRRAVYKWAYAPGKALAPTDDVRDLAVLDEEERSGQKSPVPLLGGARLWDTPVQKKREIPGADVLLMDLPSAVALNIPRFPVSTGIAPFDLDLDGGIGPGEAIVIGGGPGSFKTSKMTFIVPYLARADTAVLFIAADEPAHRVSRKIGTQYGEVWKELCSDYPAVIDRLKDKLEKRSAFVRITNPRAVYDLEDVLDAFDAAAPEGRQRIVLLDHMHAVAVRGAKEDCTEKEQIEGVVNVLIDSYVRRKDWSLISLSEITKEALSRVVVQADPMKAFAGTRKIVSRFDAAFVMVPEKGRRARVIPAKNRFGPQTPFTLEWNVENWTIKHILEDELEQAEEAAALELRQRREVEEENSVLSVLDSLGTRKPITFSDIRAKAGISKDRCRLAVDRLKVAGVVESWDAVAEGVAQRGRGARPEYIRRVPA